MQEDGCLESACVNAACLALLDSSVSLKFLISSVTVVIMSDGTIVCDPTHKQSRKSEATLVFVFSSREAEDGSASIVSCYTEGRVSQTKLQECISAAHIDSKETFTYFAECTNMDLKSETKL